MKALRSELLLARSRRGILLLCAGYIALLVFMNVAEPWISYQSTKNHGAIEQVPNMADPSRQFALAFAPWNAAIGVSTALEAFGFVALVLVVTGHAGGDFSWPDFGHFSDHPGVVVG